MDNHDAQERSLAETAMNGIIGLIIKNNMQPGDKLPTEYNLAELLGVGRSTLREATRTLAMRNILEIRQGSGTFVSEKRGVPEDPLGLTFMRSDAKLALELFDIRLILEPKAAEWAAVNAAPADIEELGQRCCEVERRIEADESYFEADEQFHSGIARSSGNRVMANLIPIVVSSIYMTTVSTEDQFRQHTYQQHRQIFNAIRRRDCVGAALAMSEHLNMNREFFAHKLADENGQGQLDAALNE